MKAKIASNPNNQNTPTLSLSREVRFDCLHYYALDHLSPEENQHRFGACYTKYGHGHNYRLIGEFEGPLDSETGMIVNLSAVDSLLKTAILPLQGKMLNDDVEDFSNRLPTTENILLFLADKVTEKLKNFPDLELLKLRLYETEELWVDWRPSK